MPHLPTLIASLFAVIPGTTPDGITADQAQLIGYGIAGVIFVAALQLLGFVLTAYKTFQKSPPLHETYATKEEVHRAVSGMKSELSTLSGRIGEIDGGIDDKLKEIGLTLRTIERALGRVEGIEQSSATLEKQNLDRFNEISKRLASIEESMRNHS